jgi:hypothetical protein
MNPRSLFEKIKALISHCKGERYSLELFIDSSEIVVRKKGKIIEKHDFTLFVPDTANLRGLYGYRSTGYNPFSENKPADIGETQFFHPVIKEDKTIENEQLALQYINPDISKYFVLRVNSTVYENCIEYDNCIITYHNNSPVFMLDKKQYRIIHSFILKKFTPEQIELMTKHRRLTLARKKKTRVKDKNQFSSIVNK